MSIFRHTLPLLAFATLIALFATGTAQAQQFVYPSFKTSTTSSCGPNGCGVQNAAIRQAASVNTYPVVSSVPTRTSFPSYSTTPTRVVAQGQYYAQPINRSFVPAQTNYLGSVYSGVTYQQSSYSSCSRTYSAAVPSYRYCH